VTTRVVSAGSPPAVSEGSPAVRTARRDSIRQLASSKTFLVGTVIVAFWIFCAIFGYKIAPHDPLAQTSDILAAPSRHYPFGTDELGRDMLSRVIVGARSILIIAPLATLLAITLGTSIGLATGYFRGIIDDATSRVVDAVLAVPPIILAIAIITSIGSSTFSLIVVIGLLFTPIVARTVRAAVLGECGLDYVQAARLQGERAPYVMFVEIAPNVMGPIIVETTVRVGYAVFAVASLTFLGFGVQPPTPDWALMIATDYGLIAAGTYWWTVLFPALAIASLVIALNLMADGFRQVFDR